MRSMIDQNTQANSHQFEHLLSSLSIAHPGGVLTLRNRVLVSAHVPGFAENNKPGAAYIDYHRRYAGEGVGLQITGGTPVHPSGMLALTSDTLWNLDDSIIPGYTKLAEAVHAEGGCMLAQLAHSGGTVNVQKPGVTTWSASAVRSSITGHVSHAMTLAEIEEVMDAYVVAAVRVRESGLDGVEILSAFGFLPQAFLSPRTNTRTDHYGGSLDNRLRFLKELLVRVRKVLGTNQILGVRLPGDEFEPGGLTNQDMIGVCRELSNNKLVDYLNITAHTNFTHLGRSKHWPPTPAPHGVFVELAENIKAEVELPVFTVGRIIDPTHANDIIQQGKADMVGMTRAHLCDPQIVSKIKSGRSAQVRPCVGANTCVAKRYAGKTVRCMHNPELALAGQLIGKAATSKTINVVGAGPAGLEAARLAAQRGHQVILFEKTSAVGGQLNDWVKVESRRELKRIVDWRVSELDRMGVEINLNTEVDEQTLKSSDVDATIIATGSLDTARTFPGSTHLPVLTPRQLLAMNKIDARNALVISDGRGQAGLVCAEWLRERSVSVELVTEAVAIADDLDPTNRDGWYQRLGKSGVRFMPQMMVQEINTSTVTLRHIYTGEISVREDIDLVVDWYASQACNALGDTMANDSSQQGDTNNKQKQSCYLIGDCLAPRGVEIAMAEALDTIISL